MNQNTIEVWQNYNIYHNKDTVSNIILLNNIVNVPDRIIWWFGYHSKIILVEKIGVLLDSHTLKSIRYPFYVST